MELMFEKLLIENNCAIEEAQVFPDSGSEFWHSTIHNKNRVPISSGFSSNRMQARKIAIAEFLERNKFWEISNSDDKSQKLWGIDIIPTACGFAAGFERDNTIIRSIREASERFVMSKWIDDGLRIPELSFEEISSELDPISSYFISRFNSVRFFKKSVIVLLNDSPVKIDVVKTMGFTEKGIFPGSSSQYAGGNIWQHALLESFRHLLGFKNNPNIGHSFPGNKVQFFANNKDIAIQQIEKAKNEAWPIPHIIFHREQEYLNGGYYIARTIFSGWNSWNSGPIERFLY